LAEQKVIALQAQVADLKLENLQSSKKLKDKVKDGDKKDEKKDGKQKMNKKDTSNKTKQKKDEAWKKVPPKAGEAKTKRNKGVRSGIGASIIKHGAFTHHRIARSARNSWPRPTGKLPTRLKSTTSQAAQAGQTICMPLSWPTWPARTWNDGSDQHGS
jgi:hypothetical protein